MSFRKLETSVVKCEMFHENNNSREYLELLIQYKIIRGPSYRGLDFYLCNEVFWKQMKFQDISPVFHIGSTRGLLIHNQFCLKYI